MTESRIRARIRVALVAAVLVLLVVGVGGGYWWGQRHSSAHAKMQQSANASTPERQVLYWYDPMVPDQHFEGPGKSPFMDMQLVPRYADPATTAGVRVDPRVQQSVGIRTAVVEVGHLSEQLRVPATLTWDLRLEALVSARVDAVVTQVHVKAPFEAVHRGQALATLLSPEWGSAIAEAHALESASSATAQRLHAAASQRLLSLGLSDARANPDGTVVLLAPRDGVVTEVLVREGQAVEVGLPLFRVNGTTTVWLEAAIPQARVGGIGPGTEVEIVVSAAPRSVLSGTVEALLPRIDPASRTQWARIVLANPEGRLAPGMFAEVILRASGGTPVPLLPTEALIATGSDSRVIVMHSDGAFEPVRVRTGRSDGTLIEILDGLRGGEQVVTSGQFLIDSEASLSGALQRLGTPASSASPAPDAIERQP
jgi:Cu(I)/Ag(I) efflux system membrane fusion protein